MALLPYRFLGRGERGKNDFFVYHHDERQKNSDTHTAMSSFCLVNQGFRMLDVLGVSLLEILGPFGSISNMSSRNELLSASNPFSDLIMTNRNQKSKDLAENSTS